MMVRKILKAGSCQKSLMGSDVFGQERLCSHEMEILFTLLHFLLRDYQKIWFWMESYSLKEESSKKQCQ